MGHDDQPADKRLTWFEPRIILSLKLRAQELKKFFDNDDNRAAFNEFMEGYDIEKKLYIYALPSGTYVAKTDAPEELKKKAMFFYRTKKEKIDTEQNLRNVIQFGDLTPDSLGSLDSISKSVFTRLIKTRGTSAASIPPVYRSSLNDRTDAFSSQLLVATGLAHGRTLLPIPEARLPRRVEEGPQDKELVFIIENAVAAWTPQIRQAINSSPEENMDQHPGPVQEMLFWKNKAENLESLENQLYGVEIAKMTVILKKAGSSYSTAFNTLIEEVGIAAAEARENYRFLKPLRQEFEALVPTSTNAVEFGELVPHFRRLFHFLSVIWTNSSTYNTPRRMVVLIREMANDLIESARESVAHDVADLLNIDNADKTIQKLSQVLNICGQFKGTYFKFKSQMNSTHNPWSFQNISLFERLDAFLERCHDVVDMLETGVLFYNLRESDTKQTCIGGAIGIDLSQRILGIRQQFLDAHQKLNNCGVDFLDVNEVEEFDEVFGEFTDIVKDLELQLGTIMSSAIDESRALTGVFKVVDTFEGFTDRITLSQEWSRKQLGVLRAYHADLLLVQEMFNRHKDDIQNGGIFPNLPPTATCLTWCQGLIDRIEDPQGGGRVMALFAADIAAMQDGAGGPSSGASSGGAMSLYGGAGGSLAVGSGASRARAKLASLAQETEALKSSLLSSIRAFRNAAYGGWASAVESVSTEKLQLNLLSGGSGQSLVVNFDPELIKALREVHYLNKISETDTTDKADGGIAIPQKAVELGNREETLRHHVLRLDYVATTYNNIIENTRKDDEKPLLRNELDLFENIISRGLRELQWLSGSSVEEFVNQAVESIRDIDAAVSAMHGNVEAMKQKVVDFTSDDKLLPLHPSKGDKIHPEHDVRKKFDEHVKTRRSTMRKKEDEIKQLLADTLNSINTLKRKCGFSEIQNSSPVWVTYVEFVNSVMSETIAESVVISLTALRNQVDPMWIEDNDGMPLMEIRLNLSKPAHKIDFTGPRSIRFEPSLDTAEVLALQQAGQHTTTAGATSAVNVVTLESFLNDFAQNVADSVANISRLEALDSSHTYLNNVLNTPEIQRLFQQIGELVRANNENCHEYLSTFSPFEPMYNADMKIEFNRFLHKNDAENNAQAQQNQDVAPADAAAVVETTPSIGGPGDEFVVPPSKNYFGLSLPEFHNAISNYERTQDDINGIEERRIIGWVRVDVKPIRAALLDLCRRWKEMFSGYLMSKIQTDLENLDKFIEGADAGLDMEVLDGNLESLKAVMRHIRDCRKRNIMVMGDDEDRTGEHRGMFPPIQEAMLMLRSHVLTEHEQHILDALDERRKPAPDRWVNLNKKSLNVRAANSLVQDREAEKIKEQVAEFEQGIRNIAEEFRRHRLFQYHVSIEEIYDLVDEQAGAFRAVELEGKTLRHLQELFDLTPSQFKELRECKFELHLVKQAWDLVVHVQLTFSDWLTSAFKMLDVDGFLDEIKRLTKQLKSQHIKVKGWDVYRGLDEEVKNMGTSLPLCAELRSDAMRERHWKLLVETTKTQAAIEPDDADFTLEKLISLGLHRYGDDVSGIVEKATKEQRIERLLTKIVDVWEKLEVTYVPNDLLGTPLLGDVSEIVEQLETDNNTLQGMLSDRFVEYFLEKVQLWQRRLGLIESSIAKWTEIQRQWQNLYPIFNGGSADIKQNLAEEVRTFSNCDELFRAIMSKAQNYTNVVELLCTDVVQKELNKESTLEEMLEFVSRGLNECEKGLNNFLSKKREIFARFFFISDNDLIDILSKGNEPKAVMIHMSKIIDAIDTFVFDGNPNPNASPKDAHKMISVQGEVVNLVADCLCDGPVEDWLRQCIQSMRDTIKHCIQEAMSTYHDKKKTDWIKDHCCQSIIVARRIAFTQDVHDAFSSLETGSNDAMKDCQSSQEILLKSFIEQVGPAAGDIPSNTRAMLKHLITIEVHNRDIVIQLAHEKGADNADCFTWQNQLRYYWRNDPNPDRSGSLIQICDAEFQNQYEYIGLCGCLVITKLTDRCYITLSQALRLFRGGAPAGPAGTGKTETTKDLARNLGIACYVFNCSAQMSYISIGKIFKGLAMSGTWGCFDEFNRISISVLSVIATQVGSILNALRVLNANPHKNRFRFMGGDDEIPLVKTVGMFITMNPGYAGRTELPENIKALFRPCAMVVPDLQNICEIMLAAEGFVDATPLALKFVTLYRLNKELLSPQDHYDWGLRAVKSVLYIAGGLRREDPELSEKSVLMRALRDTNMAKLSKDDVYVFMGLIKALFPRLEVPKKERPELSDAIKKACDTLGNVTGENDIFVLKCLQFEELLHVRHSVFILGPAGCGKTECWKSLKKALHFLPSNEDKGWPDKCVSQCLNPKAITSNEMYGYFFQKVEWRDGILSNIFREFAIQSKVKKNSKWIVLDGIIDAEWIESMNTVMDDNKVLTLVSNDRIPLTNSMRMIFEVSHLRNASPATVSRAGVVFINESDLGWSAFKDRWIASRKDDKEDIMFDSLFDKYVPITFDYYHRSVKPVIQVMDIAIVQTICYMMEGIMSATNLQINKLPGNAYEIVEKIFCFCVIWAFGGTLPGPDGRLDMRLTFSNWWRKEFPHMKMSDTTTVFDYFLDQTDYEWKPWSQLVTSYQYDPEQQLGNVSVETADTTRMRFLMSLFIDLGRPVMLVGTAGTGKTNLIRSKLSELDSNKTIYRTMSFNARTGSAALQNFMEQNIEKRTGRTFGPPNRKQLVVFFDDMNMQQPDKYGTQDGIAFIQQHLNYGFWYDRLKIGPPKDVIGVHYVGAMNPKSGSFTILDRVLRYFAVFTTIIPDANDLTTIYGQIFEAHLTANRFSRDCRDNVCKSIVKGSIDLHQRVSTNFLPTAIKFHYQWNMRELFNIFQGMCNSHEKFHDSPAALGRLWVHEVLRTFRDRMPDDADMDKFDGILKEVVKSMPDVPHDAMIKESSNIIFAPIRTTPEGDEGVYDETDYEESTQYFKNKLEEYNLTYPKMDLVLFQQAVEHICRIARVISNPRGNALLIGVGGSGKQSLARLASYMMGQEPYQITVTSNYNIADFRVNMQDMYKKTGIKGQFYTLIITDGQIVNNDMLVYLNDMLCSGNVPDLFIGEDRDAVIGALVQEVKLTGEPDYANPDVIWAYFINKVRTYFHIILCFSPKSRNFASWCRQFPGLANNTVIDWFHDWPEEALKSVSYQFLSEIDLGDDETTHAVSDFMANCQADIVREAEEYYRVEKRRCYSTPKSFLELIKLYKSTLAKKRDNLQDKTTRLAQGIKTIEEAGAQVAALQEVLKEEQVEVDIIREETEKLMETVGAEKAKVQEQNEFAEIEEAKTNKIVVEVEKFSAECSREVSAAQPLVDKARAALKTLDKNNLSELKSMGRPPDAVVGCVAAVACLIADVQKIIPSRNRGNWNEVKKVMGQNVVTFLNTLETFSIDRVQQQNIDAIQSYIKDPEFDPETMKSASRAASGLCAWVINMNQYYHVMLDVNPKIQKRDEAMEQLANSKQQLKKVQEKVGRLKADLDVLVKGYNDTMDRRNAIEARAKKTRDKADLAQRLVSGLSSENTRWSKTISELEAHASLLIGDVLLASGFCSYVGPFSKPFRERIINELWRPEIKKAGIPMTAELDVVMQVLTDEATVAQWNNDTLPTDRVSTENGAIVVNSDRWPLMIDPQLQAASWIKRKEEKRGLKIIQCVGDKWVHILQQCIEEGLPVMIESLSEHIDPVLDNVLGRNTFTKASKQYVRLGGNEVHYHPSFKLYLQTRLPNPLYKPEINAQTTLINFMVTETGLEDQLLAVVVNHERPELEETRTTLIRQMNTMTIELRQCEDTVLYELSNAKGDILENVALVESLETTKRKAAEIAKSMIQANETSKKIAINRATYQAVALRGSLVFFQIDNLAKIDHMYQYSLEAFMVVFNKALDKAARPENAKDEEERVNLLRESVTETLFAYVSRGLFERHKLIFASLLCFTILSRDGAIDPIQLDFLLRGTRKLNVEYPDNVKEFIAEPNWQAVQALAEVPGATPSFELLPNELDHARWRAWMELEKPEEERGLPLDYKNLSNFQRLLILRCLRPDRLTSALEQFVSDVMGKFFISDQAVDMFISYQDAGPTTPVFFILSPGVDPVRSIERLGEKLGITYDSEGKRLHNVSLGDGQEEVAMRALDECFENGGWALLNNIHLVENFVKDLEKKFEAFAEIYSKMAQIAKRRAEIKAHRRAMRRQQAADAAAAARASQGGNQINNENESEDGGEQHYDGENENVNNNENENDANVNASGEDGENPSGEAGEGAAGSGGDNADNAADGEGGENAENTNASATDVTADDDEGNMMEGEGEGEEEEEENEDDEDLDEELEAELHMDEKPGSLEFRVFLTAEPSDLIPIGVLQRCIKLTSEPPTGIQANVLRAIANFSNEPWEKSAKPNEYRCIMFAMCWFHAIVVERKKFGPQGWNRVYPFNIGDLTTCLQVTTNFIEEKPKVPWQDLRYVFGEIMYGGHITDDWDRTLCMAYLESYVVPDCLDGLELCPGFTVPSPVSYQEYLQIIQSEQFPLESPILYGLHPNAEINFRTAQADVLFRTITELQPAQVAAVGAMTRDEAIRVKVIEILDHLPELHNMLEITEREEERSPQQHVFYQECERMNFLTLRVRDTLAELKLGLDGALSISPAMQLLADELFMDKLPTGWQRVSFMSMRPLPSWFENFNQRNQQLVDWVPEMQTPRVTMLSYFFNPMSFLTAIMQTHSSNHNLELDKMTLAADVLKKAYDQVDTPAREGAHCAGLAMEGARWDNGSASIEDSRMKILYPKMPVITVRAVLQNKLDKNDMYECPIYKTQQRGPGFATSLFLKTKQPAKKWTIAGVSMLLDVVE